MQTSDSSPGPKAPEIPAEVKERSPPPPYRKLRAFAFDPILSRQIGTQEVNEVTIHVPWEDDISIGPADRYLEVVDRDPASQAFYPPVDLNEPHLLAQDGLPPSEANPQFHQQMVYAVARKTIAHFEAALGRPVRWSPRRTPGTLPEEFTGCLRLYPHALREANAYYSPEKKAILFGYFPASPSASGQNMPGETVFSCLSHDIVAHEMTHALVDGIHPRFIEPSNRDVLALHEALADIVALFQHFTYPEVLAHQIARTRGDLESQNLLGELAFQFGQAIGSYGALRSAIGRVDQVTKQWVPEEPDPEKIFSAHEPHDRGAILVAAVFDAFLAIYRSRIRDLIRIATGGSGILPAGDIHPDLVGRLAEEASKTARHILQICIRALDYCPPVDIDFGDYLRALITADQNAIADDRHNYRLAFIEAFRRRGIYPRDIRNLSVESLIWHVPTDKEQEIFIKVFGGPSRLRDLIAEWDKTADRKAVSDRLAESRKTLHGWFTDPAVREPAGAAAHVLLTDRKDSADRDPGSACFDTKGIYRDQKTGIPFLEVHSVRLAHRIGPDSLSVPDLVIEMTQRRRGYLNPAIQEEVDSGKRTQPPDPDFMMRGGCTLLVDPTTARVRYCIFKDVESKSRLERTRKYLTEDQQPSVRSAFLGNSRLDYFRRLMGREGTELNDDGPFALLHRSAVPEEV
jgi:hypothetical protein